jgi:hypothetical protein
MSERQRAGYPGEQGAGQEPSLATATQMGDGRRGAPGAVRRQERER